MKTEGFIVNLIIEETSNGEIINLLIINLAVVRLSIYAFQIQGTNAGVKSTFHRWSDSSNLNVTWTSVVKLNIRKIKH